MTVKLVGSSSGSVSLDAPASTTSGADIEFKLPVADGSANQLLKTDGSGQLSFASDVNIDSSGNVGIGGTPSTKLHMQSSSDFGIRLTKTANSDAEIKNTNSLDLCCSSGGSGGQIIRFLTGANTSSLNECARFTGGKDFLVGTTTDEPGNGNTSTGITARSNGRFFTSANGTFSCFNRNDSDGVVFVFARQGTHVGNISVASSSTSFNTSSDYRLKENVVAISDGITRLKTLKPSRFNFKVDKDTTVDGFLAHEVTAVPEAITGTKDEVDSDNKPVYQGIDLSKLVPLLTAALQEAIAKIETLETKVAALEAK